MKHGFLKVAAGCPSVRVADCVYNEQEIFRLISQAEEQHVKLLVLPELCLTGATCGDLFFQQTLLEGAVRSLEHLLEQTEGMEIVFAVGLPVARKGRLYDCAALCQRGQIMGLIPKTTLTPDEQRYFTGNCPEEEPMELGDQTTLLGSKMYYESDTMPEFFMGVEFGNDLWSVEPKSSRMAKDGATVICCLAADPETVGRAAFRREMVQSQSARSSAAYLFASAGEGESTSDLVFSGHTMAAENGQLLAEQRFETGLVITEIDLQKLLQDRRMHGGFDRETASTWTVLWDQEETQLTRPISASPFIPENPAQRDAACEEIFRLAALGLKRRLDHTHAKTAVIGLSGGLDSTLALLIVAHAMDLLHRDRKDILAVTMPCFGTTARTRSNAEILAERMGCSFREVCIGEAVKQHFRDIGQSMDQHDVTFENGQARERTQVLMDLANMNGGMVIGTGDLSELALGWATYNGDHMSMYGVNGAIPKTLVRHLVRFAAEQSTDEALSQVLRDILDTPVSPELLPAVDGKIAQKTEDLVGPYELHDFFLYYIVRWGFAPEKIFRMALQAFDGVYDEETILKWLKTFYRRFFMQQFKRNCLPDGPKVGTVTFSPRGDWRMPSDALWTLWQQELEQL